MTSASAIIRIALVVSDLAAASRFYEEALGFEPLTAADNRRRLRLGQQDLELLSPSPPGMAYPEPRAANDPWFEHFALAVSDMAAAYARLCRQPHEPISRSGPQLLPANTGGVTAYKFRDPDGHPLELSHIPKSRWTDLPGGPFLGIDHSAICVADLPRAIAFYEELGFEQSGRGRNHGPEQDRLDGLDGVDLDIVSMRTPEAGPHLELLHYRRPRPAHEARAVLPNDIAATRLVLQAKAPAGFTQDPDGHWVEVEGRQAQSSGA